MLMHYNRKMKPFLLICAVVALVGGCGKKLLTKEESAKVIEAAIRSFPYKPTELTDIQQEHDPKGEH